MINALCKCSMHDQAKTRWGCIFIFMGYYYVFVVVAAACDGFYSKDMLVERVFTCFLSCWTVSLIEAWGNSTTSTSHAS